MCLVSVDYNLPNISTDGEVESIDMWRVDESLPVLAKLLKAKCTIVLISHLGRPKGFDEKYSFENIFAHIAECLRKGLPHYFHGEEKTEDTLDIKFIGMEEGDSKEEYFKKAKEVIDEEHDKTDPLLDSIRMLEKILGEEYDRTNSLVDSIIMLDNIRFFKEEEDNDPYFAKDYLYPLADYYVMDALSVCHRDHASTSAVAKLFLAENKLFVSTMVMVISSMTIPIRKGGVIEVERRGDELTIMNSPMNLAVIGGSKIDTKIQALKGIVKTHDLLFIGGAMANNFLRYNNKEIGQSLCVEMVKEDDNVVDINDVIEEIYKLAKQHDCKIFLPVDAIISRSGTDNKFFDAYHTDINEVKPTDTIVDIGLETRELLKLLTHVSSNIIWNGALGLFEVKPEYINWVIPSKSKDFYDGTKSFIDSVLIEESTAWSLSYLVATGLRLNLNNDIKHEDEPVSSSPVKDRADFIVAGGDTVSAFFKYDHKAKLHLFDPCHVEGYNPITIKVTSAGGAYLDLLAGKPILEKYDIDIKSIFQ